MFFHPVARDRRSHIATAALAAAVVLVVGVAAVVGGHGVAAATFAAASVAWLVGALVSSLRRTARERDQALAVVSAREADLEHLVARLPVIVYRVGLDRRLELLVGGGLAEVGSAADALVGRTIEEVLATTHPAHPAIASVEAALLGEPTQFELVLGGRAYAVRVEPVRDGAGRPVGALGTALDVTAQHEHQRELERLLDAQRETNDRLKSVNAMKDGFLQAVSHELRTPLTSVRGFASTLERHRDRLSSDAVGILLGRLVANANKLDRLLNDLLDVDRLERGILEPRRTPVELGRMACEIADTIAVGRRNLTLDVADVTAWVDGPKVERILENLLGNAVKHTPDGTDLTLVVVRALDGVRIEVRQSGVPVPDELKSVIFEPFRQGPLRTEHQPGTGIGLSLVSRFAALHGGRAWVQDTLDGGAAFCVELPADPVEAPRSVPRAAANV